MALIPNLDDSKFLINNILSQLMLNGIDTDNILNIIISGLLMTLGTIISSYIINVDIIKVFHKCREKMNKYFFRNNSITLTGRRNLTKNNYWARYSPPDYSDTFRAVWNHIISNIDDNKKIKNLREISSNCYSINDDSNRMADDIYVVDQKEEFIIDKNYELYALCNIETSDSNNDDDDKKKSNSSEIITLEIYSKIKPITFIKQYVDNLTEKYLKNIRKSKEFNKYIYTLIKTTFNDSKYEVWHECKFNSTRNFENMFFENKETIIDQINFFENNKKWYKKNGIPYSLGIGLHGPPGTGKTSFIKALANHFPERHLICLSFKLIKTKEQLEAFFYEDRYNDQNERKSIDFSKKIIVFEDIDCASNIVLSRSNTNNNEMNQINQMNELLRMLNTEENNQNIKPFSSTTDKNSQIHTVASSTQKEPKITLDDILNLFDGLRETDGRIIIITSNHYDKLDPALIRPGRIDLELKLNLATRNVINSMHKHFFDENISKSKLKKIKDNHFSPAELINIFYYNKNSKQFVDKLIYMSNN